MQLFMSSVVYKHELITNLAKRLTEAIKTEIGADIFCLLIYLRGINNINSIILLFPADYF